MITPEYLESCPDRLVQLYEQAERDIISDIARRISQYDMFVSSAEWQAIKLQELNNTRSNIVDKLSKASGKTKTEIVKLLKEAGIETLKDDGVKPTQATQNLLNTGLKRTLGTFDNLTRTTAKNGSTQVSEALDRAYMQVSTGAFSQEAAIKTAIKSLCEKGIETYRFPTHTDHIDVVVRRAVRTGINQTAAAISKQNAESLGTDLVEVTAHSGARPSHAEWQGKVYSLSGETNGYEKLTEATGYGTVTGLCGANCRHTFHPFFEGDEPLYSEEELAEMDAPKYEYNGEKLTEYEATQRQRYIERKIRRWKRENAAMKAAGLGTDESAAKIKYWGEVQADFIGQTGLKRQYGREEVPKTNRTNNPLMQKAFVTAKTTDDAKKVIGNLFTDTELSELDSVDNELFIKTVNRISELDEKFRVIRKDNVVFNVNGKMFESYNAQGAIAGVDEKKFKNGTLQNTELAINPNEYQNKELFIKQAKKNIADGYIMPCSDEFTEVYAITHEYGHLLQDSITYEKFDKMVSEYQTILKEKESVMSKLRAGRLSLTEVARLNEKSWDIDESLENLERSIERFKNRDEIQLAKDINDEITHIAKDLLRREDTYFEGLTDDEIDISYNLSKYAKTTPYEFFAECFANSQCGEPNLLGRAMNIWLNERGLINSDT